MITVLLSLVALCLVGLLIAVLLRRPDFAVFGLTFLLTINVPHVSSQRFGVSDMEKLLLAGGVGLILAYRVILRRGLGGTERGALVMLIWMMAALNSLLWSDTAVAGLDPVRAFLPNILLAGLVLSLVDDRTRLMHSLAGAGSGCVLLAALTVLQYAFSLGANDFLGLANGAVDHIAGEVDAFRPTGPINDPNYYAQMLLPGLAVLLGASLAADRLGARVLFALGALLIAAAILLTASRGALLAVTALVVTLLVHERRASLLLFLVPPIMIALLLVPSYSQRIVSVVSAIGAAASGDRIRDASVAGRLAEMEAALIMFAQSPVTGNGFGTFESRYQQISARNDLKLRAADRAAHSLYLETAAEQGVVGLAGLMAIIGLCFGTCRSARAFALDNGDRRLRVMIDAMIAGGVGIFASALFLHDAYGLVVWLMMALLLSAGRAIGVPSPARKRTDGSYWGKPARV